VDEEDWQNEWKKYYKPLKIGKSIVIKPSWETYENKGQEIVVEIDPGMAFGTGTHESTKMCIEFLEKHIKNGNKLLDIGCGSGILSIIGAKLGCSKVLGIDIDNLAVKTSLENFRLNNVQIIANSQNVTIDELKEEKYDVVTANIVADVIIYISGKIDKFINPNGLFIVSGVIKDRKEDVISAMTENGFEIVETSNMGEWVAIVSKCGNSSHQIKA
jgi:ribosomal protein L11 methyltransferase